jgi:hypothetical protein
MVHKVNGDHRDNMEDQCADIDGAIVVAEPENNCSVLRKRIKSQRRPTTKSKCFGRHVQRGETVESTTI